MAQDFYAAFGLDGDDDTHIDLTDIAGISRAAIQELRKQVSQNVKQLADKDERIVKLESENAEIKGEFADIRTALSDLRR